MQVSEVSRISNIFLALIFLCPVIYVLMHYSKSALELKPL